MEIDEKGSFCRHCNSVMIQDNKPYRFYCNKYACWINKDFCEKCNIPETEKIAIKIFNSEE